MRILWVVPRYGREVVGGAETLVRELATHANRAGWRTEVATTCASDHATWVNTLPEGDRVEDGVRVHRFPVSDRDEERYDALHDVIRIGRSTYLDELEWLAQGVFSRRMQRFLADTAGDYDLRIVAPYLFGTSFWGAQVVPRATAMIPCLHDEPYARMASVHDLVRSIQGCIFNSAAERRLARRLFGQITGEVVGMGFEAQDPPAGDPVRERLGVERYLLYAGRLEAGKGLPIAVHYAMRHGAERRDAPPLVLMGRGGYRPPPQSSPHVRVLGYVDEETKRAAYAGALALVHPSTQESLSIVLLESWVEGTAALVNARSEVLAEHCERSGGGRTFRLYEDYRDAVDWWMEHPEAARAAGAAGRDYVLTEYAWPAVLERLEAAVGALRAA